MYLDTVRYKTVVSSFTLRCRSPRRSPGLPWRNGLPCMQRLPKHALSVFEINKYRVSQSTVSSGGIPNMSVSKSSPRGGGGGGGGGGAPPRERKIRRALFLLYSQAGSFLFSPFYSAPGFPFLYFRCCGLGANLICRLIYLAITLSKSSTRCNILFNARLEIMSFLIHEIVKAL